VHTDLDDSIAPIFADLGQMEQVVVNLAVNARDAMQNTGGSMFLSTDTRVLTTEMPRLAGENGQRIGDGTVIPPGTYVTLSIRDTGTGIAPDVLQRVFDPFFTTKVQGQGTGLGLSIAQGIIHQAGGYISVESIPDTGTTLTLYFPTPIERQREVATERRS
jgi:two-component system cell cycle sensor histidine kinase/response regulator CckA